MRRDFKLMTKENLFKEIRKLEDQKTRQKAHLEKNIKRLQHMANALTVLKDPLADEIENIIYSLKK